MGKLDETIELDILDFDETGILPDRQTIDEMIDEPKAEEAPVGDLDAAYEMGQSNVFEGEIIYTEPEPEAPVVTENVISEVGYDESYFENGVVTYRDNSAAGNTYTDASKVYETSTESEVIPESEETVGYEETSGYEETTGYEAGPEYAESYEGEPDYDSVGDEELVYSENPDDEVIVPGDEDDEFDESDKIANYFAPKKEKKVKKSSKNKSGKKAPSDKKDMKKSAARASQSGKKAAPENIKASKKKASSKGKHDNTKAAPASEEKGGFKEFLKNLTWMDAVIAVTTVAVIAVVIVLIMFVSGANDPRTVTIQKEDFESMGNYFASLGDIGNGNVKALVEAAGKEVVVVPSESEAPVVEAVEVGVTFTSLEKDMKIKFTNKKTGKLESGVLFEVKVVNPKKKELTWTDEDKDGMIYQEGLAAGTYLVTITSMGDYHFPEEATKVVVKDSLNYTCINIMDEVKDESEIDIANEEALKDIDMGTILPDTVKFVSSTKTEKNQYVEVKKSDIPTPTKSSKQALVPGGKYVFLTAGGDPSPEPSTDPSTEPSAEPSPEPSAEPSPSPTETPSPSPSPTPSPSPSVSPTPSASPSPDANDVKNDTKTPLKDKDGKQIYIKSGDKYVEAHYKDYFDDSVKAFYKSETVYVYTGWQTLDGKTYYYAEDGNKVTGEQVIGGIKYNFGGDGALSSNGGIMGIDVSKHNGNIDWKAVKNSGVNFVIIRAGYRGYGTGVLVKDQMYDSYIKGANAAGLKVGLYVFTQAITEAEAVEEASLAVSLARSGTVSYPIFIDTESGARANGLTKAQRTAICKAFCETVKSAGYTPGVYASTSWFNEKLDAGSLSSYRIWLAQYASVPTYKGRYDLWQHTSKGTVSGISGNVDLDISYMGY